ncbi:HAMP domain-containing histidine kinase [Luteimonas sp. MC1782]|uniref:sensor histidine kinase n=1 Tax=Luteimonas sp. MC1782 TaxID=2760305 RepID=UPI0016004F71|nr:HAMP domain-containing sensor histidine kinase [Luteimonas sp. MC1782]MBB1472966.1 HAMP domain-containing histidine kinase [Luteimonas sp. MC1782]
MTVRRSLRSRLTWSLVAYGLLLSLAVMVHGLVVNEHAEALVWKSLLEAEFDHFLARSADPGYRWIDTDTLALYEAPARPLPPELAALGPGVHDEVDLAGGKHVLMVRDLAGRRLALALDITDLERRERELGMSMLASALLVALLLGLFAAWGAGRLVGPLADLAGQIARLRPGRAESRVTVPDAATSEIEVIAAAVNGYLARNAEFVERERAFIDSASHELRTPISVIGGAAELALAQPGVPAKALEKLQRIHRATRDMEQLVSLLLVLAKEPARLAHANDHIALGELLPEIVEDHRPMAGAKGLQLDLAVGRPCELLAPAPVVQAAIGNLLRNAVENSGDGVIHVRLLPGAVVEIADPGQGMSPEEISAVYARAARGGGRDGGGIGLDLITRLCAHLGWGLVIESRPGEGTTARLDLGASRVPSGAV